MGLPTPLTVLRPSAPALSPLEREHWRAREVRDSRHTVVEVAGQSILDPLSTEIELLSHGGDIDGAATQVLFLRSLREKAGQPTATRMSQSQRERADAVLQRIRVLAERYPDITR